MRRFFLLVLALGLFACVPSDEASITQLIVRVSADASVHESLQTLRLRTARLEEEGWVLRSEKTYGKDVLKWPVDLVLVASKQAQGGKDLEVIIDAVDADGKVVVQTRALTYFVTGQTRILAIALAPCGELPRGELCESNPGCYGPACHTCVADACAITPVIAPGEEPTRPQASPNEMFEAGATTPPAVPGPTDPSQPDASNASDAGSQLSNGLDAQVPGSMDGSLPLQTADSQVTTPAVDGSTPVVDASAPVLDASAPDAGADSCPAGSRAGANGSCVDIDECATMSGGCPVNANCQNRTGGRDCTCKPGFVDVRGNGSECRDPCVGACDPMAACAVVSNAARCTCPAAYTTPDQGKTCVFDSSCSLLRCDTNATCAVSGTTRTCQCRTGYSGTGSTCTNINECTQTPGICGANSTCTDTAGSYTCGCQTGYRRVGDLCQKLPCTPNPCSNGGTCSETTSGTAQCSCTNTGFDGPTCANNINDCLARPCLNGGSCTDGVRTRSCGCLPSYSGLDCETRICAGPITISNADLLESYSNCNEVRGDLTIATTGFATIDASHFTNLRTITGNLTFSGFAGSGGTALRTALMDKLETVGGGISITTAGSPTFRFPRLRTIGRGLTISGGSARGFSAPALTTITGDLIIQFQDPLCTLELTSLTRITGELSIDAAPNLPASAVRPLIPLAGTANVANVGCCFITDPLNCEFGPDPAWCGC